MHLIITEKNIAARRIAQILAGREKVQERKDAGISVYFFGDTVIAGLKGHVVEIDFEAGYSNWRSSEKTPRSLIDANTLKVPTEKKIVSIIQKHARKAGRVTIATDFDTEGELIGKEAYELVRQVNRQVPVDRARFSAITPDEITSAFTHPTGIDFDLAAAGEARQVIDLIWGASLTRFISLAARRGGANILSVGRVQSPTLAMIVDREKEIEAFVPEPYFELSLLTEKDRNPIEARHAHGRFTSREEAELARDSTKSPVHVTDIKEGTRIDRAPTPFDTTSFIVAAGRIGFSAAEAMRLAEDLYMNGFISYPRTDNTVYPKSLDIAGILGMLSKTPFSKDVAHVSGNRRKVPTSGKKTSTDHPPIHPAGPATVEDLGEDRFAIYELVVRRFLATLSPDAEWATVRVSLDASGEPYLITGSRLISAGWRAVYPYSKAKETVLPAFTPGEQLPLVSVDFAEKETEPPPRFTQSRLILTMEELGLGTKSTRHEVIAKLLSRKYVEGNPLRPTLVGRAVVESLEHHADTITRPEMTRTLEQHMTNIKEKKRNRDAVIGESRQMLHQVFDQLEAHADQIGEEIMGRTDEELTIGPCPACGSDLRIRHMRGMSQFIGCNGYPDCTFNISLPGAQWGYAVRTDPVCPEHHLHHVSLVRKGARPWDLGCPLCQHMSTNRKHLLEVPSLSSEQVDLLHAAHIYSAYEVVHTPSDRIALLLGVSMAEAGTIQVDAAATLDTLKRRSEFKKFVRKHIIPRKGRSPGKLIKKMEEAGITEISSLSRASVATIRSTGASETEASLIIDEARKLMAHDTLKASGIPAVSIKKYLEAELLDPVALASSDPAAISDRTGLSTETVKKHLLRLRQFLDQSSDQDDGTPVSSRGHLDIRSVPGIGAITAGKLINAGIADRKSLIAADAGMLAEKSGIAEKRIRQFKKIAADSP
jgi:DNA topoisomerase-1